VGRAVDGAAVAVGEGVQVGGSVGTISGDGVRVGGRAVPQAASVNAAASPITAKRDKRNICILKRRR
jgi:hypothetical protein